MSKARPGRAQTSAAAARIVIVRHGETEWSASGRHTSTTDIALTESGRQQATAVSATLAQLGVTPAVVVCSPRERATSTARLAGFSTVQLDDDLVEWSYGSYEGITSAQIHQERPGWNVFSDGAPGGESPQQVTARADRVLQRYRTLGAQAGGDVLIFTHGHFGRSLTARWIGSPVANGAAFVLDPAGVTLLGHYHDDPAIVHLNVPSGSRSGTGGSREDLISAVEEDVVAFSRRTRAGQTMLAHASSPDLTLAAYRILLFVGGNQHCRVTELAAEFEVGKPTMSRQVAALEDLGLVTRRPDPQDGRGSLVALTTAGRRLLGRARRKRHEFVEHLLDGFSTQEAQTFAPLFHRFVSRPSRKSP